MSLQEIVTFHSHNVIPTAVIIMVQDRIKIWTFYLTVIYSSPQHLIPFTGCTKIFEPVNYKFLQITAEYLDCPIIKMQNCIVLFTLLTFSSVVVFAGLQEVLNVAKCIADKN